VEHATVAEPQPAPREARALEAAPASRPLVLLRLQRTAGNAAVGRLLAREVATAAPDTAKLKRDLDAKTAEARTLRTDIDDAIKTAATSLPGLEKAAKKAADAAKRKQDDATLAQTAADAQAKVDAARAATEPDGGKLTKLKQLRREALALVRAYVAALEKQGPAATPAPNGTPPATPFGPDPKTDLELARDQLKRLERWEKRERMDELSKQIAAESDATKKADLETQRAALSSELRASALDVKQFSGPWANKPYVMAKGGKYTWDEGQQVWNYDKDKVATIASSACGPTSLAIVLNFFAQEDPEGVVPTGDSIVKAAVDYVVRTGARAVKARPGEEGAKAYESQGTSGDTMVAGLRANFGHLKGRKLASEDEARKEFAAGRLVIYLMPGHFSVLEDYDAEKGWLVSDVGKTGARFWKKDPKIQAMWAVEGVY
jgi:hypothetical protein